MRKGIAAAWLTGALLAGMTVSAQAGETWVLRTGAKKQVSGYSELKSKGTGSVSMKTIGTKFSLTAQKEGPLKLQCYKGKKLQKTVDILVTGSPVAGCDTAAVTLKKGSTLTVPTAVFPAYKSCKVTYKSSSKSIASVSSKGKITARKKGTAKITATVSFKGKKVAAFSKTVKVADKAGTQKSKYRIYDGKTGKYRTVSAEQFTALSSGKTPSGNTDSQTGKVPQKMQVQYNGSTPLQKDAGAPQRRDFAVNVNYTDGTKKAVTAFSMKSSRQSGSDSYEVEITYTENGTVLTSSLRIPVEQVQRIAEVRYKDYVPKDGVILLPAGTDFDGISSGDFTVLLEYEVSGTKAVNGADTKTVSYRMSSRDEAWNYTFTCITASGVTEYTVTLKEAAS